MKNVFLRAQKPVFSKEEQIAGRTLVFVNELEPMDSIFINMPHRADFQLCFKLCNGKMMEIFVGQDEFNHLLVDDVSRITLAGAFQAEKEMVERQKSIYSEAKLLQIGEHFTNVENGIKQNKQEIEKTFGGNEK